MDVARRWIDGRGLRVECPEHAGLLLPVTDLTVALTYAGGSASAVVRLDVICPYCDRYHHLEIAPGSVSGAGEGVVLSWPLATARRAENDDEDAKVLDDRVRRRDRGDARRLG